jgi:hypothetical protein
MALVLPKSVGAADLKKYAASILQHFKPEAVVDSSTACTDLSDKDKRPMQRALTEYAIAFSTQGVAHARLCNASTAVFKSFECLYDLKDDSKYQDMLKGIRGTYEKYDTALKHEQQKATEDGDDTTVKALVAYRAIVDMEKTDFLKRASAYKSRECSI